MPVISSATALVGVLGDPIRHSLSPLMHNAALAAMGLDWVYLALPVRHSDLARALQGLEAIDCRGLNVTLPHKPEAHRLARRHSTLSSRLGAANTLLRLPEGGWRSENTDVEGFMAPLSEAGGDWRGQAAVVLGCGGSARAVVAGLHTLGCDPIVVVGRRAEALAAFVSDCSGWCPALRSHPRDQPLQPLLEQSRLVVNTTPAGMGGQAGPDCPLDDGELDALAVDVTVYDLIYTPRPTRLLHQARARGCRTLDGLEMLVQQGAASLRLWTGADSVPVETMRRAALAALA
ncbi:shikimate dehydrogenase [Synechococcus sp. RSCCF101]|uniref:shikimate dehydrogenase n=1 Tax=Synechococcus sp. RSCCF101 TaxID=2511069 RepID=UPI001243ED4C|nr:shikimate dehydrogenase [Synechococcus sp. RSCCF101]QEY32598.1 shikimate dehydrogenase [Synechococcus sp. RSCCF101]